MIDLGKGPFLGSIQPSSYYRLLKFIISMLSGMQMPIHFLYPKFSFNFFERSVLVTDGCESQLGICTKLSQVKLLKQAIKLLVWNIVRSTNVKVTTVSGSLGGIVIKARQLLVVIYHHFDDTVIFFNITLRESMLCWFSPSQRINIKGVLISIE